MATTYAAAVPTLNPESGEQGEQVCPLREHEVGSFKERHQPPTERKILGPRRPTGWVLQTLDGRRGPDRGVLHAPDCGEASKGAPALALDQALDAAEKAGMRLCSLCGAAQELEPLLNGFDRGFDADR